MANAEQRGRDAILREIAELPSPWPNEDIIAYDPDGQVETSVHCRWCRYHQIVSVAADVWEANKPPTYTHPDNGCLWPRALKAQSSTTGEKQV